MSNKETPPRTRLVFLFIGALLLILGAWVGWYFYRTGKVVDLSRPEAAKEAFNQFRRDVQGGADKFSNLLTEDLEKKIRGKPPTTTQEIQVLIEESKKEVARREEIKKSPNPPPPYYGPLDDAKSAYYKGEDIYALTDPLHPDKAFVQAKVREAMPHFENALKLLEAARAKGIAGAEIEALEQNAAKRLYDCRKRLELQR